MKNSYLEQVKQAERELEAKALGRLYRDMMDHEPGDIGPAGEDEGVTVLLCILTGIIVVIGAFVWLFLA
jgi:hypothetical protein